MTEHRPPLTDDELRDLAIDHMVVRHKTTKRLEQLEAERDALLELVSGIADIARDAHDERADRLAAIEHIYTLAYNRLVHQP